MINQPLARQWITEMRNPSNKKTTRRLKDSKGECCLGLYCRVVAQLKFTPATSDEDYYDFFSPIDKTTFQSVLPYATAKELNITQTGILTEKGKEVVRTKITSPYASELTVINDDVYGEDDNFLNMADTIELLVEHEATKGEECFEPFK